MAVVRRRPVGLPARGDARGRRSCARRSHDDGPAATKPPAPRTAPAEDARDARGKRLHRPRRRHARRRSRRRPASRSRACESSTRRSSRPRSSSATASACGETPPRRAPACWRPSSSPRRAAAAPPAPQPQAQRLARRERRHGRGARRVSGARAPRDRLDHEADDGARRARPPKLSDVVTVDPRAAAVGQESIYLRARRADHRARARPGGADPVGEQRGRRARARGRARLRRVRGADEREGRRRSACSDSHFVRPDGLDAPGRVLERARRDRARPARRCSIPFVRETVRQIDRRDRRRPRRSTPGTTCSASFPGVIGVKTGPHDGAGWSQVAAVRRGRRDDLRDDPRQPVAHAAERRPPDAARLGRSRSTAIVDAISRDAHLRRGAAAVRARHARARRGAAAAARRPAGHPLVEKVVAPTALDAAGRSAGRSLGRVEIWSGGRLLGRTPARRLPRRRPAGSAGADRLVRAAYSPQRRSARLVIGGR